MRQTFLPGRTRMNQRFLRVRAHKCQALFRKLPILWQVIPPLSGDAMHNATLSWARLIWISRLTNQAVINSF